MKRTKRIVALILVGVLSIVTFQMKTFATKDNGRQEETERTRYSETETKKQK